MASAAPLDVGYAKKDITPPLGVELTGYARDKPRRADVILDPLYARALALRDGENTVVILSCDLIGLPSTAVKQVRQRIGARWRISPEQLLIVCTHTHSGPATGLLRNCGETNSRYMSWLLDALCAVVAASIAQWQRVAVLRYWEMSCSGIGYNRVDPQAAIDETLRGVSIETCSHDEFVLANYACHPVTLGPTSEVSADYPGRLCRHLEQRGIHAQFLAGFCGDVDPAVNVETWGSGNEDTIESYGQTLAQCTVQAIQHGRCQPFALDAWTFPIDVPLHPAFAEPGTRTEPLTGQIVKIGDVYLAALPGEVFSSIGMRTRDRFHANLLNIGTANGVAGYFPNAADVSSKGYGAYASCFYYSRVPFHASIEQTLVDALVGQLKP